MRHIFLISALIIAFASCRKEDPEGGETLLNDKFGPFEVIEPLSLSTKSINFAVDGDLAFNAELSKNTKWVIEITGDESGAKRIIEGTERIISIDNAAWEGGAESFPSFGLEKARIKISFPNEDNAPDILDSVTITGTKLDDGILITSFENGEGESWSKFNQATVAGGINCTPAESAKGNCFYSWDGTVGWDWAIGSVMVKPDTGTFGLQANATNLFFNMAVNFVENKGPQNSFVLLWFDEDENGDGVFDPNTEDRFEYQYWYDKDGWDLISLNYNDIQFDADGNKIETNGNGLPEPSKLVGINVFFLANKDTGINSKAYADHIIFTTDEPYRP